MPIAFYGYTQAGLAAPEPHPLPLAEVTLSATAEELRAMAGFLLHAAKEIEEGGQEWEHEHLHHYDGSFRDAPNFIVFNSDR